MGGSFHGGRTSHGEETFNEGVQDFLALFKKTIKNKYEKFFLVKMRSSIKT